MAGRTEPVLLYAHPSMEKLAEQVTEICSRSHRPKVINVDVTEKAGTETELQQNDTDELVSADDSEDSPDSDIIQTAGMTFWLSRLNLFLQQTFLKQVYRKQLHRSLSGPCLTNTTQRAVDFRQTIKWDSFQDGFPNLFIQDVHLMAGRDVIFLGSFHSPAVIFEQLSVLYMFPRYLARSFNFILPYFPTGTMERVDTEGQIATAKTLAIMMSGIPLTARGPAQICIYDIHALQERFYFSDNVIPRLESAIPLLLETVQSLPDKDNVVFAFPDDGAFKRFNQFFPGYDLITCIKVRNGNKRIVTIKEGNPEGKHVIIVDDLVQTGGTLKESGKALLEKGAKFVSAYVTHAVFPNESWRKFTENDVKFETFWITDSLPHANEICQHKPFRLLSLAGPISSMLIGYDLVQNT